MAQVDDILAAQAAVFDAHFGDTVVYNNVPIIAVLGTAIRQVIGVGGEDLVYTSRPLEVKKTDVPHPLVYGKPGDNGGHTLQIDGVTWYVHQKVGEGAGVWQLEIVDNPAVPHN